MQALKILCFTMDVRVHCFPLWQQNQQMQALKTSYSFNTVVRIQFLPRQELHEKKIFLIPKIVPTIFQLRMYSWSYLSFGTSSGTTPSTAARIQVQNVGPRFHPPWQSDRSPSPPASYWCKRSVVTAFFLWLGQLSWHPISTHLETARLSPLWILIIHLYIKNTLTRCGLTFLTSLNVAIKCLHSNTDRWMTAW